MKTHELFSTIDRGMTLFFKWICIVAFVAIAALITANIFLRYVPIGSLNWYSEIIELCFAWMVFYGASAVWIVKGHFSAGDWIGKWLKSEKLRASYRLFVEIIAFIFIVIFFWYSRQLFYRSLEVTESLQFPKKVIYSCMPISSLVMMLYSVKFIIHGIVDVMNQKKTI